MSGAAPSCAPEFDDVATGASGNGSTRSCPNPTTAHNASAQPANPNRVAPAPITFRTRTLQSAGSVPLSSLTPRRRGDQLFLSGVGARYIVPSSLGDHLILATSPHSSQLPRQRRHLLFLRRFALFEPAHSPTHVTILPPQCQSGSG